MAHPKVAVILKRPNSKKLEEAHQFMINPKYRSQLKKVIIPLLKAVERDPEDKKAAKVTQIMTLGSPSLPNSPIIVPDRPSNYNDDIKWMQQLSEL